jgi:hypothetical protein
MGRRKKRKTKATAGALMVREGAVAEGTPTDIHALFEGFRKMVGGTWVEGGPPMSFHIFGDDRACVAVPTAINDDSLSLIEAAVVGLIQEKDARRYLFQATVSARCPECAGLHEHLVLGAVDIDGSKAVGSFEIKRDSGRARLSEFIPAEIFDCWLLNLFDNTPMLTMH